MSDKNKETNMICEDYGSKIQIIYFKDIDPSQPPTN